MALKQMLNHHLLNKCSNCGSKRIKANFEEMPEEMKKGVTELKINDVYFMYCENCKEYSMVFYD